MRRHLLFVASLLLVSLTIATHAQTSTWRPVVLSDNGMIASGHALASEAGTPHPASRAATPSTRRVAAWAVQGLTEPEMTGLGGDMFILIYLAKTGEVKFINGTGVRADGGDGGLLQRQGRPAGRRAAVGQRARRGRRPSSSRRRPTARRPLSEILARRPRSWPSAASRSANRWPARLRSSRESSRGAIGEEDLVQRRSPLEMGDRVVQKDLGGDAARDRREGQRRVLSGRRSREKIRRLHEERRAA